MLRETKRLKTLINLNKEINKIIFYERNKIVLIQRVCQSFIEFGEYYYSLIVLFDESKRYNTHSLSGEQENSDIIVREMKNGNLPDCVKNNFADCSLFPDSLNDICKNCFNKDESSNKKIKVFKLGLNGFLLGILYLAGESRTILEDNESNIISDILKDLSFALYNFDVSERKLSSKNNLSDSDNLYRIITETIRDGLVITENDKIVFANRKISEIFGLSEEELLNSTIFDLVSPENEIQIIDYNKNKFPEDLEFWITRKDEKRKYIRYRSTVIKNKKNSRLIVITNITGKKKNEEKLLIQQEYINQLFENSPLGIVLMDNKTRVIKTNKGFEKLFYYSQAETTGKYLKDLILPDELKSKSGSLERMLIDGNKIFEETIRKRKDNSTISVERLCYPIYINNKTAGLYSIYSDITERKEVEQAMRIAKEKAEQSEKIKSDFLAQMSHEIRTPINSILSFTNLIKEEIHDNLSEDLESAFYYIDNGSRRLIRTIDLILNMSEMQNGTYELEPDNINLYNDILVPIFNEFKNAAKEKLLSLTLKDNLAEPYIYGDMYTISQIFENLINNAIKFTKSGTVDIVIYRNENNFICVDIRDTGVGISEEYLSKLFKPFSQEESGYTRRFEGNGLGLALVKKYIELNNADIWVKSEKGKGSTFGVIFLNSNNV